MRRTPAQTRITGHATCKCGRRVAVYTSLTDGKTIAVSHTRPGAVRGASSCTWSYRDQITDLRLKSAAK